MNAPIAMSSTYVHDATIEYGRDGNAGWGALEAALGALDGGRAVTFASGLAAATAIADLVPVGGTVVLSSVTYFGVRNIFERLQASGRLQVRLAPADDSAAIIAATDGADMVWVESIANPLMVVADVPAIAAGARERGAITVVDATFATPLRQRPLDLGARHRPALRDEAHRRPLRPAARGRRVPRMPRTPPPSRRTATTTARSPARSRRSSRCAASAPSPSGSTGPRRRRRSSPAASPRTRVSRRSTTRACRVTRSTSAPAGAADRLGADAVLRSRRHRRADRGLPGGRCGC